SSSVPIIGAWDFSIHLGLTAGYVTDGYKQGWIMAGQGLAILSGAAPSEVEPITESPNTYMVNEPGLIRYDAHMAAVPPEATVLNHRPTFVEQHGDALIVAAIVLVVLGAIIALLGFHARRMKHSEARVRALNAQLSRTVNQKSLLMREAHHRIKNNLQVLEGLVSLEMSDTTGKETTEVLSTLKNRCRAIGLVHKQLYRTDDVERVSLHTYFGELIDHLYSLLIDTADEASTDQARRPVAIEKRIEHVHARMDTAVPLGLITTELISNSLKHAATDRDAPSPLTISIDLERTPDSHVALVFRDNGRGYNGAHQHSEGLGLSLVRSLSAQLGGSIRFFDDGGAGIELVWREKVGR
ncbi:MAG: sensor histidine kinase, partial [Spirochaetales bacterium]|nr:sensor histidine kinase [Spirochaetales bacterium]